MHKAIDVVGTVSKSDITTKVGVAAVELVLSEAAGLFEIGVYNV